MFAKGYEGKTREPEDCLRYCLVPTIDGSTSNNLRKKDPTLNNKTV